jgi:hypothetical protein
LGCEKGCVKEKFSELSVDHGRFLGLFRRSSVGEVERNLNTRLERNPDLCDCKTDFITGAKTDWDKDCWNGYDVECPRETYAWLLADLRKLAMRPFLCMAFNKTALGRANSLLERNGLIYSPG